MTDAVLKKRPMLATLTTATHQQVKDQFASGAEAVGGHGHGPREVHPSLPKVGEPDA